MPTYWIHNANGSTRQLTGPCVVGKWGVTPQCPPADLARAGIYPAGPEPVVPAGRYASKEHRELRDGVSVRVLDETLPVPPPQTAGDRAIAAVKMWQMSGEPLSAEGKTLLAGIAKQAGLVK